MVGTFSLKFSIGNSGETTDWYQIKRVRGYKNGTDLLYHHAKYGGDRRSHAGCRPKSVMFFCLFVTLWNDEVCDNVNTINDCNFQNSYSVIA